MPRKAAVCPPGVWCFTPSLGVVLVLAVVVAAVVFMKAYSTSQQPIRIFNQIPSLPTQPASAFAEGGDDRYTRAPEPLRFWQTAPDLRGAMLPPGAVPINVSTRGLPQSYQQMGLVRVGEQLLPLYGRQTAYRNDRYNYYTRTDTFNPIQVPIRYQKRDCMDSIGCEELLGGETVNVGGLNRTGHVEVYKFDGPTYIPGLV